MGGEGLAREDLVGGWELMLTKRPLTTGRKRRH
jgi:hypothetical protein